MLDRLHNRPGRLGTLIHAHRFDTIDSKVGICPIEDTRRDISGFLIYAVDEDGDGTTITNDEARDMARCILAHLGELPE